MSVDSPTKAHELTEQNEPRFALELIKDKQVNIRTSSRDLVDIQAKAPPSKSAIQSRRYTFNQPRKYNHD